MRFVLPPFFTDSSHCLPHQVRSEKLLLSSRQSRTDTLLQTILLRDNGRIFRCSLLGNPPAAANTAIRQSLHKTDTVSDSIWVHNSGMYSDRLSLRLSSAGCFL